MFLDLIEKIRSKSENYRRNVSMALSLFLTMIIFTVWTVRILPSGDSGTIAVEKSDQVATVISSKNGSTDKGPIENFGEIFGKVFLDVKDEAGKVKKSIEGVLVPFINGINISDINLPGESIFEERIEIDNRQ